MKMIAKSSEKRDCYHIWARNPSKGNEQEEESKNLVRAKNADVARPFSSITWLSMAYPVPLLLNF